MSYANRVARPVAVIVSVVLAAIVAVAVFPRHTTPAGQCAGRSGHAAVGAPYAITLRAEGDRIVPVVDFDRRLWRAIGARVTRDGLVPPSQTELRGAMTLVSRQEATFSSPAAYATFLPLTRADGCGGAPVTQSGAALPHPA